jgi:hypothetical protein
VESTKPNQHPPVVICYRVYCGFVTLLSLAAMASGILLLKFRERISADQNMPQEVWLLYGIGLLVLGGVSFIAYLIAFFLPRKPRSWIYHTVMIALGMGHPCSLPVTLPLLIFWIKPEVQEYFGQGEKV